jgi:exodeoxyribonuclease I
MAFVFYDLETSGLDTRFDQILHFAAIRTNADLIEEQRVEFRCRLDCHLLPNPQALIITRRTLNEVRSPALASHYAMMCEVAQLIERWSPATIVGFNSIRFDEAMLQHGFYRTLHDPYLTSRNYNTRADALTLCRATAFFSPGVLNVPVDGEGQRRFSLKQLHTANCDRAFDAHSAMGDVEATLDLCRLIKERDDDGWSRFQRFSGKAAAASLIDEGDPFGTVRFRGNQALAAPAVLIGRKPGDANLRFCLDLSADLGELAALPDDTLVERLATPDSPLFRLRVNACPALCDIWDLPASARPGLDDDVCVERAARVIQEPTLGARILAIALASERAINRSEHVEAQLYDELLPDADLDLARAFHAADWPDRESIAARFADNRWRRLAQRLFFLEVPHLLPEDRRESFEQRISDRLRSSAGSRPWTTIADALAAIDALGDACPPDLRDEYAALT